MIFASALFLSLTFVALARRLGVFARPFAVAAASRRAYAVLTDVTLDDEAKETMMQQSARELGGQFAFICGASLAAVAPPLAVVWGLSVVGLVSLKAVAAALLSWQILLSSTLVISVSARYERSRVHGAR